MDDSIQKQAEELLVGIEKRVLYLREQKRLATEVILHGEVLKDALTSIQKENRLTFRTFVLFHSEWASLIPELPEIRAVLAYLIADKYDLIDNRSRLIWNVLELDNQQVHEFYQERYGQSIETIRSLQITVPDLFPATYLGVIELNTVYNNLRRLTLQKGDILFNQGDSADNIYALAKGYMKVFLHQDGEKRLLRDLNNFNLIGEMALLTGESRNATIQAVTDCELWYLSIGVFKELMEDSPESFTLIFETASSRYYYSYFIKHMQAFFGKLNKEVLIIYFAIVNEFTLNEVNFCSKKMNLVKGGI
jgi:hypothetical protein